MLTKMYYYVAAEVQADILSGAFKLDGPPQAYLLRRSAAPGALERMDLSPEGWRQGTLLIEPEAAASRIAATLAADECLALISTAQAASPDGRSGSQPVVLIQVLSKGQRLAALNPVRQALDAATLEVTAPELDPWWAAVVNTPKAETPGCQPGQVGHSAINLKTCH